MNQLWKSLNLRPHEQRLLVIVSAVVFVVLNVWFVRPHFGDLAKYKSEMEQVRSKLRLMQAELSQTNTFGARLRNLEKEGGVAVTSPGDEANVLMRAIGSQATLNRVKTSRIQPKINPRTLGSGSGAVTNQFFDEETVLVGFTDTGDKELLDFLVALSTGELMVRVRDLDIKPQPPANSLLTGTITLVASYQKSKQAKANNNLRTAPRRL